MNFNEFCKAHTEVWNRYLRKLHSSIAKGKARLGEGVLLYPNMVLYTETDHHYLAELFGASLKYKGITPRRHKESSTVKYLFQFTDTEENPMFLMNARCNSFKFLLLSRNLDETKVKQRFGIDPRKMYPSSLNITKEGGSLLSFGSEFQSCFLDNCLLINSYQQIYRMKSILNLTVVSKTMSVLDFLQDMKSIHLWPVQDTSWLRGVYYCPHSSAWGYILSGQLANVFLVPGLIEPNIGKFLHENQSFVLRALDCTNFLYEQQLDWKEGNPNMEEQYIQPDLLLKSASGYWDICDLKRPLLDKSKITKGKHSRRRFIDYVEEGIAQLANYEHYFAFKENIEYARNEYGVLVDNPRLILIVGNYENAEADEVKEAARMLKSNYTIMDYDTLNANFLLHVYSN